ncbi:hypothetical protein B6U99_05775 [Candidatus Geothermarchaeota archaeon ex4572_27]|nr:MAG: hypothetical protein B6U99_05775 [Candidatus Geothermarchaeota archaeon ex4572_27]
MRGRAADRLLSCLSNPLRLDIVRALAKEPLLSFTDLMRRLGLDVKVDTGRFGYHLRRLVDEGVVRLNPSARKYELTELGRQVADLISTLEDTAGGARSLLVRTSKLQMEPFNRAKIAEALEREAGVPKRIAADIAREAEERILRLNVKYLTAPLIREIVNTILIERGLEDYRHSLTRLGLPVHDVTNLIRDSARMSSPEYLYRRAGESILAEYTLLKALPRHVADAHLSGSINVSDLPGWTLRLNSLHHDLRSLLAGRLPIPMPRLEEGRLHRALKALSTALMAYESHVAREQELGFFNVMLAPYARGLKLEEVKEELRSFISELNWRLLSARLKGCVPSISLELCVPKVVASMEAPLGGVYADYEEEAMAIAEALIELLGEGRVYSAPQVVVKVRGAFNEELLLKAHEATLRCGQPSYVNMSLRWQGDNASYAAFFTRLGPEWRGDWELDTLRAGCLGEVSINVPRVAYEAEGSDDLFMEALLSRVELAVNAFTVKRDSVSERLRDGLLPLLSHQLDDGPYLRLEECSYNLCLVGLPEAVKMHVGEYPYESRRAASFALRVLRGLSSHLEKLSDEHGLRLLASTSPSEDPSPRFASTDLSRLDRSRVVHQGPRDRPYYSLDPIAPRSAYVPLRRRARLDGMVHSSTPGGHVSSMDVEASSPERLMEATLRMFREYGVAAIAYSRTYTQCSSCLGLYAGVRARCPRCGSTGRSLTHYGRADALYKPSTMWSLEERDALTKLYRYELE